MVEAKRWPVVIQIPTSPISQPFKGAFDKKTQRSSAKTWVMLVSWPTTPTSRARSHIIALKRYPLPLLNFCIE